METNRETELTVALACAESTIAALRSDLAEATTLRDQWALVSDTMEVRRDRAVKECDELRDEVEGLNGIIAGFRAGAESALAAALERIGTTEAKCDKLQADCTELANECSRLTADLAATEETVSRYKEFAEGEILGRVSERLAADLGDQTTTDRVRRLERLIVDTCNALGPPAGSETVVTKGSDLPRLVADLVADRNGLRAIVNAAKG